MLFFIHRKDNVRILETNERNETVFQILPNNFDATIYNLNPDSSSSPPDTSSPDTQPTESSSLYNSDDPDSQTRLLLEHM